MRVCIIAGVVAVVSTARAQAPRSVSGKYRGDRGDATLVQDGTRVLGTFRARGEIDGELAGDVLRFTWRENGSIGRGVMLVAGDGALIGTWGTGDDERDGGSWSLTPLANLPPPAIVATSAPRPVNHAGVWSFSVTFPWDVSLLSGRAGLGVGGFGIGTGVRLTDALYVGASADVEMVLVSGASTGVSNLHRLRGGVELRYYAHDDVAPNTFGGSQRWIGARAGLETVDDDATVGRFAELTFGRDSNLGGLFLGTYISTGLSFEQASAYQDMTAMPGVARVSGPSPTLTSPYFIFGMRLGFQ